MNDDTAASEYDAPGRMDRRQLVKRGALLSGAVGAAWASPTVFDSFASPAAAATTPPGTVVVNENSPKTGSVQIPANRQVEFELVGGGGGGGGFNSFCGGSGTKVTGTIAAQPSPYTLNYHVAAGGGGGEAFPNTAGGAGGSGYSTGGSGGVTNANGPGGGGGGGGASAIVGSGTTVIAPGGGGTGGGGNIAGASGGKHPASASGPLNRPGAVVRPAASGPAAPVGLEDPYPRRTQRRVVPTLEGQPRTTAPMGRRRPVATAATAPVRAAVAEAEGAALSVAAADLPTETATRVRPAEAGRPHAREASPWRPPQWRPTTRRPTTPQ